MPSAGRTFTRASRQESPGVHSSANTDDCRARERDTAVRHARAGSTLHAGHQGRARHRPEARPRRRDGRGRRRRQDCRGRALDRRGEGAQGRGRTGPLRGAWPHRPARPCLLRNGPQRIPEQRHRSRAARQPLVPQRSDDAGGRGRGRLAQLRPVQGAGHRRVEDSRPVVPQHRRRGDARRSARAGPRRHERAAHRDAHPAAPGPHRRHQGGALQRAGVGSRHAGGRGRHRGRRTRDDRFRRAQPAALSRRTAEHAPSSRRHPDACLCTRPRPLPDRQRAGPGGAVRPGGAQRAG